MASAAAPSSLMLTYTTSSVNPQDFTPSLYFKPRPPLFRAFSLYPLVSQRRERKSSTWVDGSSTREAKYGSYHVVVAALATETEVDEGVEEEEAGDGVTAVSTVTAPKPKKGKAALLLKRDRTRSMRFLEIQKLRENKKEYDLKTAISLLKQMASTKFIETAEAHFRLNIDPKYNDQQLRATVNLAKRTGQTVEVAVLTQGRCSTQLWIMSNFLRKAWIVACRKVNTNDLIVIQKKRPLFGLSP